MLLAGFDLVAQLLLLSEECSLHFHKTPVILELVLRRVVGQDVQSHTFPFTQGGHRAFQKCSPFLCEPRGSPGLASPRTPTSDISCGSQQEPFFCWVGGRGEGKRVEGQLSADSPGGGGRGRPRPGSRGAAHAGRAGTQKPAGASAVRGGASREGGLEVAGLRAPNAVLVSAAERRLRG